MPAPISCDAGKAAASVGSHLVGQATGHSGAAAVAEAVLDGAFSGAVGELLAAPEFCRSAGGWGSATRRRGVATRATDGLGKRKARTAHPQVTVSMPAATSASSSATR